jgi:uncharacterized protein (DUF4415 family)
MTAKRFSSAELEELAALARLSDQQVDTSDIAEITKEQWQHARRGGDEPQSVSVRLDATVVQWFRTHSKGNSVEADINAVLRQHALEEDKKSA